jgi:hypothetical protein
MGNFIKATYHAITQSCKLITLSNPYKAVLTDFCLFQTLSSPPISGLSLLCPSSHTPSSRRFSLLQPREWLHKRAVLASDSQNFCCRMQAVRC